MPRRHRLAADRRACPAVGDEVPGDSVDRIVAEWAVQRPDLAVAPIEVLTRLSRLRTRIDEELAGVFARFDLSAADFIVIAALRRAGPPYTLPQSVLMERLRLTSGTVSVRLARLEEKAVVQRSPSSTDGRGVLVSLTPAGLELFDRVAPEHLANEEVLLSALTDDERGRLVELLRKLLVSLEREESSSPLGLTVRPAHRTRQARTAVGLSDQPGLLVSEVLPGSCVDRAGVRPGDVLIGLDDRPLRCSVDLDRAAVAAAEGGIGLRLVLLHGEQRREVVIEPPRA